MQKQEEKEFLIWKVLNKIVVGENVKEELVDVYDQNRKTTGKIINRRDIGSLTNNEYIITVHCFIINSSNQILLTQRSFNKNR